MKKKVVLIAKILGGIIGVVLVLLIVAGILLNTRSVQQKLLVRATDMLQEKLQTKVKIDSIHVDFLTFDINLTGLDVEDRQQRKMLQADRVEAGLVWRDLLVNKVKLSDVRLEGLRARLYQPEDSAANYQFVIDAFKKDEESGKGKEESGKRKAESGKGKLSFDVSDVELKDIDVVFNADTFLLERLNYSKSWLGKQTGSLHNLRGQWDQQTKKGPQTNKVSIATITVEEEDSKPLISIDGLHFAVDNHLPRKNEGKPQRGAFDAGHLNVDASLTLQLNHYAKDTLNATLIKMEATDTATGFNVKDLRFQVGFSKGIARLSDVTIQQESTVLTFDEGVLQLPSKKQGTGLAFHTSEITGHTLLKDIAKPFAPVLSRFVIPLELKVKFSGTDSTLVFKDIHVNTADKKLTIDAQGGIDHLQDNEKMDIHFRVSKMTTPAKTAQDIINQFAVKKFMMKQMLALNTIRYTGDVNILYKKEVFKGLLGTSAGNINASVTLDENDKYVRGAVSAQNFQLGRVLDIKDIGNVSCKATFSFDMSKPRTAQMRKKKGGKLPIGQVAAQVAEASYKKAKVKNLDVDITSDGALATGSLAQKNKNVDLSCDFSFTETDSFHKMKIKPKVKLHDMPWQKKKKKTEK